MSKVMLNCKTIIDHQEFLSLKSEWNELVAQTKSSSIYMHHQWLESWWNCFGNSYDLYIVTVSEDNKLIGIAPFMIDKKTRSLSFIGTPNADYSEIIGKDISSLSITIAEYLLENQDDYSEIVLTELSENFNTLKFFYPALKKQFPYSLEFPTGNCARYKYSGTAAERTEFKVKRGKSLKNLINSIKKQGELKLSQHYKVDDIKKELPTLFEFHQKRWNNTKSPSKFNNDSAKKFYNLLVENLAPTENLHLYSLSLDKTRLAYFFIFSFNKKAYLYTPAYNEEFKKYSVGKILNVMLSEELIKNGCDFIDFTRGDETYKQSLTNQESLNFSIVVYKSKSKYQLRSLFMIFKKSGLGKLFLKSSILKSIKKLLLGDSY